MILEGCVETLLFLILLLLVAWPGDRFVENFVKTLPPKSLLRASDTLVHGIIGAISWQLVCIMRPHLHFDVTCLLACMGFDYKCVNAREKPTYLLIVSLFNMCLAFALASAVDLDHILKDIVNMIMGRGSVPWHRGWFHLVLPPLTLTSMLYLSGVVFRSLCCVKVGTFVMICVVGHHIRDAIHHGLWLQPFGITPRFPFWLYLTLTMVYPYITSGFDYVLSKRVLSSHPEVSILEV